MEELSRNGLGQEWGYGIADLTVLLCFGTQKHEVVREGLQSCVLADGRYTVILIVEVVPMPCIDGSRGALTVVSRPGLVKPAAFTHPGREVAIISSLGN